MKNKITLLLMVMSLYENVQAVSLVYNLRTRRVFSQSLNVLQREIHGVFTAVPIVSWRTRHIVDPKRAIDTCNKSIIGGSLLNVRWIPIKNWWIEMTTGIEKEHVEYKGTSDFTNARTGFDDFIFSGGHNFIITKKIQCVPYVLGGLPSRRKVTVKESLGTLVGTRFYSVGAGLELSYGFIQSPCQSLNGMFQTRFIHFFSRNWFPILPCDGRIQPGNITDLLFTMQYRYKKNVCEIGYNPTFFTNQAVILKTGTQKADTVIRNGMYANYIHAFLDHKIPFILGGGFSLSRSKTFDTKTAAVYIDASIIF